MRIPTLREWSRRGSGGIRRGSPAASTPRAQWRGDSRACVPSSGSFAGKDWWRRTRPPVSVTAQEADDDLGPRAVQLAAADLDHAADRDRLVAAQVEDALEDEVRVEARGPEGGRISRLQGEGQQDAGIERPVVVGVAGQDEAVGPRLVFIPIRIGHAHRVRRFRTGWVEASSTGCRESLTWGRSAGNRPR